MQLVTRVRAMLHNFKRIRDGIEALPLNWVECEKIKQHLGFEDVATSGFDSVMSHVYWVYCAYILLHLSPPGVSVEAKSLGDKQRQLQRVLENQGQRRVIQKWTQIGGVERYKDELRQALADA